MGFVLLCLPIFGMVALGWAAIATQIMPPSALDVLGSFSFRYALPALVLHLIGREPLTDLFEPIFFTGYLASGCLVFALTFAAFYRADGTARASARATTASVGNLGFFGPPIVLAFLGQRGAGPLAMAIVCEVMIVMSIGAILMAGVGAGDGRLGRILARSTIGNPVIAAIALGTGMAAARLPPPKVADDFLVLLGASAAPTALFAVGGTLAILKVDRTTAWVATIVSGIKLVIYPAAVWCVLAWGLRMDPFWSNAGALMAALPSAGSNFVLAQHYTDDAERSSAGIVLSTVFSVVTLPIVGWLLQHG